MILSYRKFPARHPVFPYFLRAQVDVCVWSGSKNLLISGVLDTGADHVLLNKNWAKGLGIDWKKGVKTGTIGVEGRDVPVYIHDMEMEVKGITNSRRATQIGFIDSPSVGLLLGQRGFFEFYRVTFDYAMNCVEIVPAV